MHNKILHVPARNHPADFLLNSTWIFQAFYRKIWKQSNAIFSGKIAWTLEPFKKSTPPLSFYLETQ